MSSNRMQISPLHVCSNRKYGRNLGDLGGKSACTYHVFKNFGCWPFSGPSQKFAVEPIKRSQAENPRNRKTHNTITWLLTLTASWMLILFLNLLFVQEIKTRKSCICREAMTSETFSLFPARFGLSLFKSPLARSGPLSYQTRSKHIQTSYEIIKCQLKYCLGMRTALLFRYFGHLCTERLMSKNSHVKRSALRRRFRRTYSSAARYHLTVNYNWTTKPCRSACCSSWRRLHNTVSTSFKTTSEAGNPKKVTQSHLAASSSTKPTALSRYRWVL